MGERFAAISGRTILKSWILAGFMSFFGGNHSACGKIIPLKLMRVLFYAVFFILIFTGITVSAAPITGEAKRPFPAIMPLDYPYARAMAWVNALIEAVGTLPPSSLKRLEEMGLDNSLGRRALCAVTTKVNVVTPEIAPGEIITAYLQPPSEEDIHSVLAQPEIFVQDMFLLFDMEQRLNMLSSTWPRSVAEATGRMEELVNLAEKIEVLWDLLALKHGNLPDSQAELEKLALKLETSAVVWLNLGIVLEKNNQPQAALNACNRALELCENLMDFQRGRILAAQIYYARALAQEQLAQPALALADVGLAADELRKSSIKTLLLSKILLFDGELKARRNDYNGMCTAFQEACVLGECGRLAAARRDGHCKSGYVPPPGPLTPETLETYMP